MERRGRILRSPLRGANKPRGPLRCSPSSLLPSTCADEPKTRNTPSSVQVNVTRAVIEMSGAVAEITHHTPPPPPPLAFRSLAFLFFCGYPEATAGSCCFIHLSFGSFMQCQHISFKANMHLDDFYTEPQSTGTRK